MLNQMILIDCLENSYSSLIMEFDGIQSRLDWQTGRHGLDRIRYIPEGILTVD